MQHQPLERLGEWHDGLFPRRLHRLDGLHGPEQRGAGFVSGNGSALRNCSAAENGDDGFRAANVTVLRHCAARRNGRDPTNAAADGFELISIAHVSECSTIHNGGSGIRATSFYHYIESNAELGNPGGGITLSNATNVVIWNRVSAGITPEPSYFIGPFHGADTTKPFSNF